MAGKADFTEDEWKALQQGVTGAGMLVSTAHRDFTDSFGEASTVVKQLAAHREDESQLVRELSETRGTGFGVFSSPKEVGQGTMNALSAAVRCARARRHRTSSRPYRDLVLDVATAVAEAKGGVQGRGEGGDRQDHRSARNRPSRPATSDQRLAWSSRRER